MLTALINTYGELTVKDTETKVAVTVENSVKNYLTARRAVWLINNYVIKTQKDLLEFLEEV
jgi:hypothetical protein